MDVRLWTYPKAMALCEEHYPDIWATLQTVSRPVMMVDMLRWVVVHHHGGIYWQMNTTPLVRMESFLPAAGKGVRLFTEFDLSEDQCQKALIEPIRRGEPEEAKRISTQVFSAVKGAGFIKQMIQFLLARLRQHTPTRDYDILFIAGNAAASTGYDQFGKNDATVEVVGLADSRRMMKLHYEGSWRTDAPAIHSRQGKVPIPQKQPFYQRKCKDLYFRHMVRHAHEELFDKLVEENPEAGNRALDRLAPFIKINGIKRIVEVPGSVLSGGALPEDIRYVGGSPSRAVLKQQKKALGSDRRTLRQIHLLYSDLPQGDLFLCPEYLEWIPFREALRILERVFDRGYKMISFTHHPLLNRNWDTALGDHRPLNLCQAPFPFGEPLEVISWPAASGRPDRSLAVWDSQNIIR
ncbi:MAG: hypothetical protein RBS84_00685 [Kiritimatiellia bacterium]|nr:hypothetical protein [Kiritimatiellia bacterium]